MRDPNAYPELILDSAQEEIRALAHERSRAAARRAAKSARRRSRGGRWSWWSSRVTRSPERGD